MQRECEGNALVYEYDYDTASAMVTCVMFWLTLLPWSSTKSVECLAIRLRNERSAQRVSRLHGGSKATRRFTDLIRCWSFFNSAYTTTTTSSTHMSYMSHEKRNVIKRFHHVRTCARFRYLSRCLRHSFAPSESFRPKSDRFNVCNCFLTVITVFVM